MIEVRSNAGAVEPSVKSFKSANGGRWSYEAQNRVKEPQHVNSYSEFPFIHPWSQQNP